MKHWSRFQTLKRKYIEINSATEKIVSAKWVYMLSFWQTNHTNYRIIDNL
jgi:hypothetical protein